MRFTWMAASLASLSLAPSPAHSAPLLVDSFETGDMSASSADGFSWAGLNRTDVVTMAPGPTVVWSGTAVREPDPDQTKDWRAKDGAHSLRFRYPAGEPWAEQRFNLGSSYPDIWFRFWMKVPPNFRHGSANNKLFALWMDDYSAHGDGPTVVWESWGDGSGGSELAIHWSEGEHTTAGSHLHSAPFISVTDGGR